MKIQKILSKGYHFSTIAINHRSINYISILKDFVYVFCVHERERLLLWNWSCGKKCESLRQLFFSRLDSTRWCSRLSFSSKSIHKSYVIFFNEKNKKCCIDDDIWNEIKVLFCVSRWRNCWNWVPKSSHTQDIDLHREIELTRIAFTLSTTLTIKLSEVFKCANWNPDLTWVWKWN